MISRVGVIHEIIRVSGARTYLEIGVRRGACFLKVRAPKKIGVDPQVRISPWRRLKYCFRNPSNISNEYFEMTSDEFFRSRPDVLLRRGLDVVFIDGLHTYAQSLRDVESSLGYLNDGGVILLHDCNPSSEAAAQPADSLEHARRLNLPGWTGEWCGDVWKTICHLRSTRHDLEIFVLDCDHGLGVVTRGSPADGLKYSVAEIRGMSYEDLKTERVALLNLKRSSYLEEFIATRGSMR